MHAIDIFCRSDLNGMNLTGKGLIDDVERLRSEGSSNYQRARETKDRCWYTIKLVNKSLGPRLIRLVYNNEQTP